MRKGKSVAGLKVIGQSDGTQLGTVKDLIFDHETSEVLGLLISEKELFGIIDAQVVPWTEVRGIGPDAIMVVSRDSVIRAGDDPRIHAELSGTSSLVGKSIHTTDGRNLGAFSDIYFEDDGRVVGYEVSGGLFADAVSGRRFMPVPKDFVLGNDVALVAPEIADQMEAQKKNEPGGLQGKAADLSDKVNESASSAYHSAATAVTDTYSDIATASIEKQKAFVIGKTASHDVVIPIPVAVVNELNTYPATPVVPDLAPAAAVNAVEAGAPVEGATISELGVPTTATPAGFASTGTVVPSEVLVHRGEMITASAADRAEASGVLSQLVTAAVGGSAAETYDAGKAHLTGTVASGTEAASASGSDAQARAASAAIGKRSARDVVSADGTVIVAAGEIVTPEIMERARLYGKEKEVIIAAGLGAASENVSAGVETVKQGATNLWSTLKGKVEEYTATAQEKKAEQDAQEWQARIDRALGRPVTRIILDRQDNVILNTGDIITNAAIERAQAAGVLVVLLDSVYVASPEITPEMLRVKDSGEESLPNQHQPQEVPLVSATPNTGIERNAQDGVSNKEDEQKPDSTVAGS